MIPNGLAPETLPPPSPEALSHWEGAVGRDFFLFVGVLRYYKGLRFLIEAAAGAPFRIVIAGSGEEEGSLRRLIAQTGADNVTMVGRIDDPSKAALLQLCRGVVLPSHMRAEAFGMVLLEGAICARPLVSCEMGSGTTYVNAHEESGLTVPPADPVRLREALTALHESPERARRLGEGARRRYDALFTAEQLGRSYLSLYRELVARPTARAA